MTFTSHFKPSFTLLILFCSFLAQANLFDYYGIPNAQTLPEDIKTLITQTFLQQNPFPFIPEISQPTASFQVNYTEPWGVGFVNDNTIITNSISAFSNTNSNGLCQTWKKDTFSKWSLSQNLHMNADINIIETKPTTWFSEISLKTKRLTSTTPYDFSTTAYKNIKVPLSDFVQVQLKKDNKSWQICPLSIRPELDTLSVRPAFETFFPVDTKSILFIALINSADPTNVEIWKNVGTTWKQIAQIKHTDKVYSASFDNEYKQLATASADNAVYIYDTKCFEDSIDSYMPNQTLTLEQLLFLKLVNDTYAVNKSVPLPALAHLFDNNSQKDNAQYLSALLSSFGNKVTQTLINQYKISNTSNSKNSSCSIQ
ncbi:hypothetical protein H0X48_04690 [Candidatus Dependentiae bacterium]|nr:hypothetical protein [Candidatus Dependentiae bacterium]